MAKTAVARTISPLIGLLAALALVAAALLAGMLSTAGANQAASIWNKTTTHQAASIWNSHQAASIWNKPDRSLTLGHPGHPTGPGARNRSRSAPGCRTIDDVAPRPRATPDSLIWLVSALLGATGAALWAFAPPALPHLTPHLWWPAVARVFVLTSALRPAPAVRPGQPHPRPQPGADGARPVLPDHRRAGPGRPGRDWASCSSWCGATRRSSWPSTWPRCFAQVPLACLVFAGHARPVRRPGRGHDAAGLAGHARPRCSPPTCWAPVAVFVIISLAQPVLGPRRRCPARSASSRSAPSWSPTWPWSPCWSCSSPRWRWRCWRCSPS